MKWMPPQPEFLYSRSTPNASPRSLLIATWVIGQFFAVRVKTWALDSPFADDAPQAAISAHGPPAGLPTVVPILRTPPACE